MGKDSRSSRRLKAVPPALSEEDEQDLNAIFNRETAPTGTNSTIVSRESIERLEQRGYIYYRELPGFVESFGEEGWRVSLTEVGRAMYPRAEY